MVDQAALRTAHAAYTARYDGPVAQVVRAAAAAVPVCSARLRAAGVDPLGVRGVADLTHLPVLGKDEVLDLQRADPPWGGLLAPDAEVVRVFQSPGPMYEPQLAGADHWRWGQALRSLGVGPADTVLNCFGYHLSPAGAMLEAGAHAVGARVVPGGIGHQELQAHAVADLGVTAYMGLPSYLKALLDRYDQVGLDPGRWRLRRALVTAEPLSDSLRALLTVRVQKVCLAYGTAETGLLAYEPGGDRAGEGMVLADGVLVQVCDPLTGAPVDDDREGQVVVTLLRPDYPLLRFGTGDLSAWALGADGELRLRGVLGRIGEAVKVKGMFLYPRQAAAVLDGVPGVRAYRLVIGRADHVDTLRCEVVAQPGADEGEVLRMVRRRVLEGLRFRADVVVVPALTGATGPLLDTRDGS